MSVLDYVLQAAPGSPPQPTSMGNPFIFEAITAVSMLLVTVGILYLLMKLGRFLDALKDKV